jgi:hypothetical protein
MVSLAPSASRQKGSEEGCYKALQGIARSGYDPPSNLLTISVSKGLGLPVLERRELWQSPQRQRACHDLAELPPETTASVVPA